MANLPYHLWFLALSLAVLFPTATSQTDTTISTDPSYYYNQCAASTCGNLTLQYPFIPSRFCRNQAITTTCVNNDYLLFTSRLNSGAYRLVSNISSDSSVTTFSVASDSLFSCGQISTANFTADPTILSLTDLYTYGTHLNCTIRIINDRIKPASCIGCDGNNSRNFCYYVQGFESVPGCDRFYMFPPKEVNVNAVKDLRSLLQKGFMVRYTKPSECLNCETSGGRCGSNPQQSFVCFCPSSVHPSNCTDGEAVDLSTWVPSDGGSGMSKKLAAALLASAAAVLLISLAIVAIIFIYRKRRSKKEDDDQSGPDDDAGQEMDFNDLVGGMAPASYAYSEILKITSNFSNKLGEGGFGTVYKGIIPRGNGNGLPVAIKVLKKSKRSEKQFMNEVATVGRIHHHNLVRLVGYCAKGKTRALVYEFQEKGSLEKYIYNAHKEEDEYAPSVERLSPQQLYNIALETARGILYLHQGCRSRILHCDIKPHNVLLDSNYSAKVADFGLARMIDKDRSHVSLTVAQGTPGYAAPEMWSKSYGPITEKSDVYSYGMLLLEMAGGRKNYDADVSASSQIYFPEWVFKRVEALELRTESGETVEADEEEGDVLKKMCLVGLWCIQHIPSNRPSMIKVIQMLEGKVDIGTPPPPFPEDRSGELNTAYFSLSNPTVYLSARKTEDAGEYGG